MLLHNYNLVQGCACWVVCGVWCVVCGVWCVLCVLKWCRAPWNELRALRPYNYAAHDRRPNPACCAYG